MSSLINAKIYKIVCGTTNQIYIGSTTKELSIRLRAHELDFKKYNRGKYHYVSSFAILCNNNYTIELIIDVLCSSQSELFKIEGAYIRDHEDTCVNRLIPGRNRKEHYNDTLKKHICECGHKYTMKNKRIHIESEEHQQYIIDNLEDY